MCEVLGMDPSDLHMVNKQCTPELYRYPALHSGVQSFQFGLVLVRVFSFGISGTDPSLFR